MDAPTDAHGQSSLRRLEARVNELEARIAALESTRVAAPESTRTATRSSGRSEGRGGEGASPAALNAAGWTVPYVVAELEVAETWIELHEPSARPQLQRLLRQVVDEEGPITDRLALDRVRRAWGLRRAGGRVQEAFDQAVRQLLARALVQREGDALVVPGTQVTAVRVPTEDEATRRGAEDVPLVELALALANAARAVGRCDEGDLTMQVAKLLGWTRRGGAIQERLAAALDHAASQGMIERAGGRVRAVDRA